MTQKKYRSTGSAPIFVISPCNIDMLHGKYLAYFLFWLGKKNRCGILMSYQSQQKAFSILICVAKFLTFLFSLNWWICQGNADEILFKMHNLTFFSILNPSCSCKFKNSKTEYFTPPLYVSKMSVTFFVFQKIDKFHVASSL